MDTSFWHALDELCRQSGNVVRPSYSPLCSELVAVAGSPSQGPVAYQGPLRASIPRIRSQRGV